MFILSNAKMPNLSSGRLVRSDPGSAIERNRGQHGEEQGEGVAVLWVSAAVVERLSESALSDVLEP